ncbi:hypothetical protein [Ferdinandcohnia sp. Marseille-Q9671]
MQPNKNQLLKIGGWLLFLLALGLFFVQIGYSFLHTKYEMEYSDNRIFYFINITIAFLLASALLLLLNVNKKWIFFGSSLLLVFITINGVGVYNHKINHIVSISADNNHVFVLKEDTTNGESTYYRTYYGLFARKAETLPYKTKSAFKVKWVTNDVAALTYKAEDQKVHQFIGTYGDRGGGGSYYYVGPSIYGEWKGDTSHVSSSSEGITVTTDREIETFTWDSIVQFGTLAVVLVKDQEAKWMIALNEDFKIDSSTNEPPKGTISLYKATMEEENSIIQLVREK